MAPIISRVEITAFKPIYKDLLPVEPHEAVAEVSRIGNV